MEACIGLARHETHTGALEWFAVPIVELSDWIAAVKSVENKSNKNKRRR